MNLEQVNVLVERGESAAVEFKKSTALLRSAFETVCAFLNNKGGVVLIGVNDNGQLVGQDVTNNTRQEIAREISKIEPMVSLDVHYIPVKGDKSVIALQVDAGSHTPYVYDGRAFQRNQSSTNRMSQHRYEQLLVQRGQLNHAWEELIADEYTINDLDQEEIHRTVIEGVQENRMPASALKKDIKQVLTRLGLMSNGRLKRAAIALFAKEVFPEFMQCMIKMARFKGINKLGDFIDNQQIYCNVFKMLTEADSFLRRHLPIASFFKPDSFERVDQPALPVLAIREALINAICHRDYTNRAASISLAIYDDRLEIWNNGFLPEPLKISDLKKEHDSLPRNKLISKVFHVRGLIETWGTGTNKMIELCKEAKMSSPYFRGYSGGFSVIFKFREPIGVIRTVKVIKKLNPRQEKILALIKQYGAIGARKIISELKDPPSQRMIRKDLDFLRVRGLIWLKGHGRTALWSLKK